MPSVSAAVRDFSVARLVRRDRDRRGGSGSGWWRKWYRRYADRMPRLSLLGRSVILVACEITSNVVLWVLAGLLFGLKRESRSVLSLCLLAWVIIIVFLFSFGVRSFRVGVLY